MQASNLCIAFGLAGTILLGITASVTSAWLAQNQVIGLGRFGMQCKTVTPAKLANEAPFLAENDAAMTRMMAGMTVKPSGEVDADFAAMMIAHHQGAVDMAMAELRHGQTRSCAALRRRSLSISSRKSQPCGWPSASRSRRPPPRRHSNAAPDLDIKLK